MCCEGLYETFHFADVKRESCVFMIPLHPAKNICISLEKQQPSCHYNAINMRRKVKAESWIKQNEKEPGLLMIILSI